MKNAAIICEYNPLHKGHKKQIEYIKSTFKGNCRIISLMSGNFSQRGEAAIYPKHLRAAAAVNEGCDLVLEYPYPYSCSRAESFAYNAVYILEQLGFIDYLCFGSEKGDLSLLEKAALNLSSNEFEAALSSALALDKNKILSYATVRQKVYNELYRENLPCEPNDILAVEYLKSLIKLNSSIKPMVIQRLSDYSAGTSRGYIRTEDKAINDSLPPAMLELTKTYKPTDSDNFERAILAFLRSSDSSASIKPADTPEDLLFRILNNSKNRKILSLNELINKCVCKKYTAARIRRTLLYLFFATTDTDLTQLPSYTSLLAFTKSGAALLSENKKRIKIKLISNPGGSSLLEGEPKRCFERANSADNTFSLFSDSATHVMADRPYLSEYK